MHPTPTEAEARLSKRRKAREMTNSQQESNMQTTSQKWTQVKSWKVRETGRSRKGKKYKLNKYFFNIVSKLESKKVVRLL